MTKASRARHDRATATPFLFSTTGSAMKKRTFLTSTAAMVASLSPAMRASVWAAGSDAPEKKDVKIGFIPLTDCASVVMAAVKGFDRKYGLTITPSKEASWA